MSALEPRGQAIVRYFRALGLANGDLIEARSIASSLWPMSRTADFVKAASVAGSTIPSEKWGAGLVLFESAAAEFFALIAERSVPGRMFGIRRAPLLTRLITETQGASASWVREGSPKPISEAKYSADTLKALKVVSVCVVTLELLKTSNPAAEDWLKAVLVGAAVRVINESFTDPSNAGIADEEPASITYGATSIASSGDWAADLTVAFEAFAGDLETSYLLLNGITASGLTGAAQPNLTARGGELSGIPTICDPSIPVGTVILADAAQIALTRGTCHCLGLA